MALSLFVGNVGLIFIINNYFSRFTNSSDISVLKQGHSTYIHFCCSVVVAILNFYRRYKPHRQWSQAAVRRRLRWQLKSNEEFYLWNGYNRTE